MSKTKAIMIANKAETESKGAVWFQRGENGSLVLWFKGQHMKHNADVIWTQLIEYRPSSPKLDRLSGQYVFKVKDVYSN